MPSLDHTAWGWLFIALIPNCSLAMLRVLCQSKRGAVSKSPTISRCGLNAQPHRCVTQPESGRFPLRAPSTHLWPHARSCGSCLCVSLSVSLTCHLPSIPAAASSSLRACSFLCSCLELSPGKGLYLRLFPPTYPPPCGQNNLAETQV